MKYPRIRWLAFYGVLILVFGILIIQTESNLASIEQVLVIGGLVWLVILIATHINRKAKGQNGVISQPQEIAYANVQQ